MSGKLSGLSESGWDWDAMVSVSSLSLRLETDTDSPLGSLLRPNFPSFSMATKEVRTLDRGRGDAEGEGVAEGANSAVSYIVPKSEEKEKKEKERRDEV